MRRRQFLAIGCSNDRFPMSDGPRPRSVIETIRPFRWRIAFTYALNVFEDLLELAYPWATGSRSTVCWRRTIG